MVPSPGPAVLRIEPTYVTSSPSAPEPDSRLLRDATVILQNASARGQRLSQRNLARELLVGGHEDD